MDGWFGNYFAEYWAEWWQAPMVAGVGQQVVMSSGLADGVTLMGGR